MNAKFKGKGTLWKWVAVWFLWCSSHIHAEVFVAQATHVSDGDTLWVLQVGEKTPRKLRLLGLDAPEICQAGGIASSDALQQLVIGKRLLVSVNYHDKYGRGLARISVDDQDVGSIMVRSGQAWSNRWHRSLGPYAKEEAQARNAYRGLFADPAAESPSNFRNRFGNCYPGS
jgi:endonuclease YncB( thermonuclease family)